MYNESERYRNLIIHPSKQRGSRIPEGLNIDANASLHRFYFDEESLSKQRAVRSFLNGIIKEDISHFITFFENKPTSIYLIYKLRKRCPISLAPDGNKPYLSWTRLPIIYRIKKTLKHLTILWVNELYVWKIYITSARYAAFSEIKEVWLTNPDLYEHSCEKTLRKIGVLDTEEAKKVVNNAYQFSFENLGLPKSDILLYVNNNYYNDKAYYVELEVIKELQARYVDKHFAIKPHPLTPKDQIEKFKLLPNLTIIEVEVPVELLIANLNSSIIFSFWSAGLMLNNSSCNFFWLYPIMRRRGVLEEELTIGNPTNHIKVVDNIDLINFNKN